MNIMSNFLTLTINGHHVNKKTMQAILEKPAPEKYYSKEGFIVADVLEERARSLRNRRKRVRTRAVLLAVAAREIEMVGYDALTVDHLVSAAGMVRGTFYLYFHSRSEITRCVLRKYWALMRIHRPKGGHLLDLEASINRANRYSVMLAAKNPRLLEAREILLHEDPAVASRMAHVNRLWAERIVRDLVRRNCVGSGDETPEFLRMKARAVINMSDTLLADVHRMSDRHPDRGQIDLDLVIRVMNDLWYRALYQRKQDLS